MARSLNERITILRRNDTRDADGGERIEWIDHATVFASADPLRGQALIAAQAETTRADYNFTIRYRDDIKPRQFKVAWNNREFEVTHIAEIGRRHKLRMLTRETV